MVGKRPVRSVTIKSLGSITAMQIVLDLGGGDRVAPESTGSSGDKAGGRAGAHVDRTFLRASLAWPFAVARLFGRCFEIKSAVRPDHVEKLLALMAEMNEIGTGQKEGRW